MPRGEQKNLKYNKETSWIKININGKEESFRIKDHEFDTRTLKTEYVHRRHWDSYPRAIAAKKKVYSSESGLKSAYTVTYPLGNHDLWTKHYLDASKLATEIEYLEDDIKENEKKINSWKNNQKVAKIIRILKKENEQKINDLCQERNKKDLVYEKIISYQIPVRSRVFLSPYTLKVDKYGIGPLDELGSYRTPEVLYSMDPQKSIENIRNDKERNERLEKLCEEIHDHQGRVNQLEDLISEDYSYYNKCYSVDYNKIGDLSYFKNNIHVSFEYDGESIEFKCAKSVILHANSEFIKYVNKRAILTQLKDEKLKKLKQISSSNYLNDLYNEVNRVSVRREKIEKLQRKRNQLNQLRERKKAEQKRQEEIEKQQKERARREKKARLKRKKELKEDMENYLLMLKGSRHGHGHKDSEGNEKTWYETKDEAIAAALKLAKKKDRLLKPYYVILSTPMEQQVKGWFLTSVADKEAA
tara:strand:- start:1212 stop:2627 length:1416 start_codon:yes stop_codon:yes gene_type:complete